MFTFEASIKFLVGVNEIYENYLISTLWKCNSSCLSRRGLLWSTMAIGTASEDIGSHASLSASCWSQVIARAMCRFHNASIVSMRWNNQWHWKVKNDIVFPLFFILPLALAILCVNVWYVQYTCAYECVTSHSEYEKLQILIHNSGFLYYTIFRVQIIQAFWSL